MIIDDMLSPDWEEKLIKKYSHGDEVLTPDEAWERFDKDQYKKKKKILNKFYRDVKQLLQEDN